MQIFDCEYKDDKQLLALGAESAGNFSIYMNHSYYSPLNKGGTTGGMIYFSEDFGDLLIDENFKKYKSSLFEFIKKYNLKPDIILTDLHPLYRTTSLGQELSKKFKARHIQVQHHLAHIFSAIGDKHMQDTRYKIQDTNYGIALDGTGFGEDGRIWGGEIFKVESRKSKVESIERIGHLENQIMIGGELAIKEPARMLIAILNKIASKSPSPFGRGCPPQRTGEGESRKNFIYSFVKKYYSVQEFEVLYNQLQQNFNCIETSSCGRVLDAVSLLLGFCGNERKYKHEPIDSLEKNSGIPYKNLQPAIIKNDEGKITSYELQVTPLFEYLLKNIHKDKSRLAATAQLYIAEGLYRLISNFEFRISNFYLAGGIANNKIISKYFESKNFYINKKVPRGDAGLSFGQIIYHLLNPKS